MGMGGALVSLQACRNKVSATRHTVAPVMSRGDEDIDIQLSNLEGQLVTFDRFSMLQILGQRAQALALCDPLLRLALRQHLVEHAHRVAPPTPVSLDWSRWQLPVSEDKLGSRAHLEKLDGDDRRLVVSSLGNPGLDCGIGDMLVLDRRGRFDLDEGVATAVRSRTSATTNTSPSKKVTSKMAGASASMAVRMVAMGSSTGLRGRSIRTPPGNCCRASRPASSSLVESVLQQVVGLQLRRTWLVDLPPKQLGALPPGHKAGLREAIHEPAICPDRCNIGDYPNGYVERSSYADGQISHPMVACRSTGAALMTAKCLDDRRNKIESMIDDSSRARADRSLCCIGARVRPYLDQ